MDINHWKDLKFKQTKQNIINWWIVFEKETNKNNIAAIEYPIEDEDNSYIIPTTVKTIK